jgi:hypothetical protein
MENGAFLTKATIWVAITAYAAGTAAFVFSREKGVWSRAARLSWTIACAALFAHVACAFHLYHGWSQEAAYLDTARQTNEVVGLDWGGGLYINYALMTIWLLDVTCWWLAGLDSYRRRPWLMIAAWHGFLIFIIFNATVVFKAGVARWSGLCLCLGLCLLWGLAARGKFFDSTSEGKLAPVGDS